MLAIDLPPALEKHFQSVIQDSYQGDLQAAISAFLILHEKYGRKEQLRKDVAAVRSEVRRKGGITEKMIDDAIKRYRKQVEQIRV